MNMLRTTLTLALLALAACTSETGGGTSGPAPGPNDIDPPGIAGCKRSVLEADFSPFGPMSGAGVDPATGALGPLPAGAVASSTYLALAPGDTVNKRFSELMGPIMKEIATQPGLIGWQLAASSSCGSARTLTVWKDEASMLAFVMGPAHSTAMASAHEVSRGGSVVTSWEPKSAAEVSWESAAKQLATTYGPYY